MNNELYRYWKNTYYNYFYNFYDSQNEVEVPGLNVSYPESETNFIETKNFKEILSQCNSFISLAEKREIRIDWHIESNLIEKIDNLKKQVEQSSKSSGYEEEHVWICSEKDKIAKLLENAKELLISIQGVFLPLFFEKVAEYEEKVLSDKVQIEEIKNKETINKLSSKFSEERSDFECSTKMVTLGIIFFSIVFLIILIFSPEPSKTDLYYMMFFYLKRISILTLASAFLFFLITLRKEYFNLAQHYLHKEVLAGSFINFQEQIDKLPESVKSQKQDLNLKLLGVTINELGKSPLDKTENKDNQQIIVGYEILKELLTKLPKFKNQ